MQNSSFTRKAIPSGLLGSAFLFIFTVGVFYFIYNENDEIKEMATEIEAIVPKAVDTVSYDVTGIAESGQALTLYAKRSGFVKQITVTEGDVVSPGSLLVVAVDPVVESRIGVQEVAGVLNALRAKSGSIEIDLKRQLAEIGYGESIALSAITTAGSVESAELAEIGLRAVLSQVELTVPQALKFVKDNRTTFTSDSRDIYDEVVVEFYGSEPNYLRSGLVSGGRGEDLFELINLSQTAPKGELISLSEKVTNELTKILDLYKKSESEFFDENEVSPDSDEFAVYIETRASIATLLGNLIASTNSASVSIDTSEITAVRNGNSTSSARLGLDAAKTLSEITAVVEGKINDLSSAEMGVLSTELGLGFTEAPFSAVVMEVMVEPGQYVNAGEPLVRLVGNDVKEMKVKMLGVGTSVAPGDSFIVNGKTVGAVDRVVPILETGSITAYIALFDSEIGIGETVRGQIIVYPGAGYVVISRDYMRFDQAGPYVMTKAGEKIYFKIIHDTGESLVVAGEREINEELIAAFGVRL